MAIFFKESSHKIPQYHSFLDPGSNSNGSGNPPRSPTRSIGDDMDYQMNNLSLLKAQLKLVTHERDMLKKDVKKITMERDGAYKHLTLTTAGRTAFAIDK